jgi:hypothetical protein
LCYTSKQMTTEDFAECVHAGSDAPNRALSLDLTSVDISSHGLSSDHSQRLATQNSRLTRNLATKVHLGLCFYQICIRTVAFNNLLLSLFRSTGLSFLGLLLIELLIRQAHCGRQNLIDGPRGTLIDGNQKGNAASRSRPRSCIRNRFSSGMASCRMGIVSGRKDTHRAHVCKIQRSVVGSRRTLLLGDSRPHQLKRVPYQRNQ